MRVPPQPRSRSVANRQPDGRDWAPQARDGRAPRTIAGQLDPAAVLTLQRTAGNAAVGRAIAARPGGRVLARRHLADEELVDILRVDVPGPRSTEAGYLAVMTTRLAPLAPDAEDLQLVTLFWRAVNRWKAMQGTDKQRLPQAIMELAARERKKRAAIEEETTVRNAALGSYRHPGNKTFSAKSLDKRAREELLGKALTRLLEGEPRDEIITGYSQTLLMSTRIDFEHFDRRNSTWRVYRIQGGKEGHGVFGGMYIQDGKPFKQSHLEQAVAHAVTDAYNNKVYVVLYDQDDQPQAISGMTIGAG